MLTSERGARYRATLQAVSGSPEPEVPLTATKHCTTVSVHHYSE